MEWTGNLTVSNDGKEDTYSPGTIDVERYSDVAIALSFASSDGRAKAIARMSIEECKALVMELIKVL